MTQQATCLVSRVQPAVIAGFTALFPSAFRTSSHPHSSARGRDSRTPQFAFSPSVSRPRNVSLVTSRSPAPVPWALPSTSPGLGLAPSHLPLDSQSPQLTCRDRSVSSRCAVSPEPRGGDHPQQLRPGKGVAAS